MRNITTISTQKWIFIFFIMSSFLAIGLSLYEKKEIVLEASVDHALLKKEVSYFDKVATRLGFKPKKSVSVLDPIDLKQLNESLVHFEEVRKKSLFPKDINSRINLKLKDPKTVYMLSRYYGILSEKDNFEDADEKLRMGITDYLGEIALGNIEISNEIQDYAKKMIFDQLKIEINLKNKTERQLKSLVGDKIDFMSYYTQLDKEEALAYLLSNRDSKYREFIEEGFFNGLFFLNSNKNEISSYRALLSTL